MCDIPFFPIFPICFQCGTDQNPCHCKVVFCWPLSIFCGCGCTQTGKEFVFLSLFFVFYANDSSMLAFPVKLNGMVSNTIPF
ncbi:hypothetical protein N7535_000861 [Penicillium sp. DV-2018c]|nr:hypothetical protein N7461_005894 [Penicillium sp. DV-2018c]KAJ5582241.1 hypothetical protein N7535_000861 [Penicillium sp. DV-2018c]